MALEDTLGVNSLSGLPPLTGTSKPEDYYKARDVGALAKGELAGLQAQQKETSEKAKLKGQEQALAGYKTAVEDSGLSKQINDVIEQRNKQFVPTQESAGDLANVFTLTSLVGFMLGGAGKGHAQQALAGMNGMLEGHNEGNEDRYKKEKTIYEENAKALDRLVSTLQEKKKEVLELAKTDYDAALLKAEESAHTAGAPFLAEIAKKQGLVAYGEYADSVLKQLEKKEEAANKLKETAERNKETARHNVEMEKHQRNLENLYRERQKATGERTAEKLFTQTEWPLVQGIRGIEDLQTKLRDPEVQKGWASATAPLIQKLGSIDWTGDPSSVVNDVNRALTGNDKTTLFLKDALLRSYEIERATRGGGRLTVQDVRTLGPVLNPAGYDAATYNQLLDDRRRVLYENLQDLGMKQEEIQRRTTTRAYTPFGGQQQRSSEDQEALSWANAHPNDPRAAQIKQRLGVK